MVWDDAPAGAYDGVGVVELTGTADAGAGATLAATVRVQVTEAASANGALAAGTTAGATFTEPGYAVGGVVNGNLTDKAWSNWVSGTKRASDTLTVTLPGDRDVTGVVTRFWKDGSSASWAQSVRLQALVGGTWTDVGAPVTVDASPDGPAPAVEIPADVRTSSVRVVLTARANTHLVVSEIEVLAKVPGTGTDAAASGITVAGEPLTGFDPAVTTYDVPVTGDVPAVEAVAHDPWATVAVEAADGVPGTTTVRVTAEDGTQRAYALRWTADAGAAPVAVTAETRCLAGKVYVAVRATNDGDAPLDVTLATPYGTRTVAAVAPGRAPTSRSRRARRPSRRDGRRDGRRVRAASRSRSTRAPAEPSGRPAGRVGVVRDAVPARRAALVVAPRAALRGAGEARHPTIAATPRHCLACVGGACTVSRVPGTVPGPRRSPPP